MATAFSDPNLYFRIAPVDPTNWDLAFKAFQFKQGKYDMGKMKVDRALAKFASFDIGKKEVKERFEKNIQNLINEINASGATDFSDDGMVDRILGHIGKALDEPTVRAIAITEQYKQFMGTMDALKVSKQSDLYDDRNFQDVLMKKDANGKSFEDWMTDGDAESIWTGNFNYTPYYNYEKEDDAFVMKILKENKDKEVLLPEMVKDPTTGNMVPTGANIKWNVGTLTSDHVRMLTQMSMTPEKQRQMAINARASYGWFKSEDAINKLVENATVFYDNATKQTEDKIKALEVNMSSSPKDSEEYKKAEQMIEMSRNNLTQYQDDLEEAKKNIANGNFDSVATGLESAMYSDRFVLKYQPFYQDPYIVDKKLDPLFEFGEKFNQQMKLENFKQDRADQREAMKAQLEAEKDAKKAAEESMKGIQVAKLAFPGSDDATDFRKLVTDERNIAGDQMVGLASEYVSHLYRVKNNPAASVEEKKETEFILWDIQKGLNIQHSSDATQTVKALNSQAVDNRSGVFNVVIGAMNKAGGASTKTAISSDGINFNVEMRNSATEFNRWNNVVTEVNGVEDETAKLNIYKEGYNKLASGNSVVVSSESKDYNSIVNRVNVADGGGNVGRSGFDESLIGMTIDPAFPVSIVKKADGFHIQQYQETTKDGEKKKSLVTSRAYTWQDIVAMAPNAAKVLDPEVKRNLYGTGDAITSQRVAFKTEDVALNNFNSIAKTDEEKRNLTMDGALFNIKNSSEFMTVATYLDTELFTKLKGVLSRATRYQVNAKQINVGNGPQLDISILDNNGRKVLYKRTTGSLDDISDILRFTPQLLFVDMIKDEIAANARDVGNTFAEPTEGYKNLFGEFTKPEQ